MIIKNLFFLLCVFISMHSYAQQIKIFKSFNSIKDAERILLQEKTFVKDTVALKNYLQPLLNSANQSHRIFYYGLLANGYADYFERDNTHSLINSRKAIELAKAAANPALMVWAEMNYAKYRYRFNQYTQMLPVFTSAVKTVERMKRSQIILPNDTYRQIAFVMQTIGAPDEAIAYFLKVKDYVGYNTSENAAILDNMGICFLQKNELDRSLKLSREANAIASLVKDSLRLAKTFGNIGNALFEKKLYTEAETALLKDIQISEKLGNRKNAMFAYQLLAKNYIAQGKMKQALAFLDQAQEVAVSSPYFKSEELNILKMRLKALDDNSPDELSIRKRIAELEDYGKQTDGETVVNTAQLLIQKAKYESQIDKVNSDLQDAAFQKRVFIGVLFALLIIALFLYKFFKIKLKVRKLQNEENLLRSELAKQDYERKLSEVEESISAQIELLKYKNTHISALNSEIGLLKKQEEQSAQEKQDDLEKLLESHLMTDENWSNFKNAFERKYPGFYTDLNENFPELTASNHRVILLHKLNFNNTEIAGLLGVSPEAIKKSKQRLRKKLSDRKEMFEELITPFYSNN
ncbi:tetratricopeptide repeat protein [Kaistella palustris]|uniref:tetratricopeptide repeat protein n=1 Tax=Kaistella palustris TaxID=493376 RepID=UPI00042A1AA2|nr:tetratricopeptide repeat protein [Kaistella palustris]